VRRAVIKNVGRVTKDARAHQIEVGRDHVVARADPFVASANLFVAHADLFDTSADLFDSTGDPLDVFERNAKSIDTRIARTLDLFDKTVDHINVGVQKGKKECVSDPRPDDTLAV